MELGNMIFGNSRGPIPVPREIVETKSWQKLTKEILQVEDYHCCIGEYFTDEFGNYKERTNGIIPNKYGGYQLIENNEIIFEIFPYWWGDCTCGAEDVNEQTSQELLKKYFTKKEIAAYNYYEKDCKEGCPCFEKYDMSNDEKIKICTCKTAQKNKKMEDLFNSIKDKVNDYENDLEKKLIKHNENCCLVKHNFIFHPGKEDEFWIDWYKYPFRDSYMNRDFCIKEIEDIFYECIKSFQKINQI